MDSYDAARVLSNCRKWQPRPGYFPRPIGEAGEEGGEEDGEEGGEEEPSDALPVHAYVLPGSTEAEQDAYLTAEAVLSPLQHVQHFQHVTGVDGEPSDAWREWLRLAREALDLATARAIASGLAKPRTRKG